MIGPRQSVACRRRHLRVFERFARSSSSTEANDGPSGLVPVFTPQRRRPGGVSADPVGRLSIRRSTNGFQRRLVWLTRTPAFAREAATQPQMMLIGHTTNAAMPPVNGTSTKLATNITMAPATVE